MDYQGKKVLILGLGKSGKASAEFLRKKGAIVTSTDDRIASGEEDPLCEKYDFAVISPGVPLTHRTVLRLRSNHIPILSELDLAYINSPSTEILAVSGTNGKTTTCKILCEMLKTRGKCHLVGNIGTPFIGQLSVIDKKDPIVVEVSSFQIEQSGYFAPKVAALTNVGEDHLDRHLTVEKYQRIKLSFVEKARIAVLNADDAPQRAITGGTRYSTEDPTAEFYCEQRVIFHSGREYSLPSRSRGVAYDLDFLCAFATASAYCGAKRSFLSVYDRVEIPPYRNQPIGMLCGAEVINDSKATNIDATLFATSRLCEPAAIILGGSDKGEDYSRLMRGIAEKVERIYLVGANAGEMFFAAEEKVRRKCRLMSDLESCVRDFAQDPLKVLLFSPASASFDAFRNYEERGKFFNDIVEKYRKGR